MNEPIEIWPNGDIEFGHAKIDGDDVFLIQMTDDGTGQVLCLYLRKPVFVTLADHMKMTADAIVDGSFFVR